MFLGNISKEFSVENMKKTGLNGYTGLYGYLMDMILVLIIILLIQVILSISINI